MTREEYLKYQADHSLEITPVLFFFYKLKGGHLDYATFSSCMMRWLAIIGHSNIALLLYYVFTQLDFHFKLKHYDKRMAR